MIKKEKMEDWYTVSLGDGITAVTPSAEIQEQFLQSFTDTQKLSEMAVFTRLESEGRLFCEVIAYFSPAAAEIAGAFDAIPCKKPERAGLSLLAGDEHALSVLFPESIT